MFERKSHISFIESLVLITFIGMTLFLPLLVLQVFGKSWSIVTWHSTSDLSMLEWTSAFVHVFLFLLFFEQFYTGRRFYFIIIGCSFLLMGITNFAYALTPPNSELALYYRFFSFLIGGGLAASSIFFRKTLSARVKSVIFKIILPSVLVVGGIVWAMHSFQQLLPLFFKSGKGISLYGRILFIVPCFLFFVAAICWLHEYIKEKKRIDFLFTVVFILYAQIILLFRGAESWGIIWWFLHVMLLLNALIACVYMLVLCVYRSIVWKLIFSLGLAFSLTVLIASGIIQRHYQKQFIEAFSLNLHQKYKAQLMRATSQFAVLPYLINLYKSDFENIRHDLPEDDFVKKLSNSLLKQNKVIFNSCLQYGFLLPGNVRIVISKNNYLKDQETNKSLIEYFNKKIKKNGSGIKDFWSPFYYDSNLNAWTVTYFKFMNTNNDRIHGGYAFFTFDVNGIKNPNIFKTTDITRLGGEIVFNRDSDQLLYSSMPGEFSFDNKLLTIDYNINSNDEVRELIASVIDIDEVGENKIISYHGRKYFISANIPDTRNWLVVNIVDYDNFPNNAITSRYFFIGVGMITMLLGFIVLMVLLRYLLSIPLRRILYATKEVEDGDFDVLVKINDRTELGVIAASFNHMVKRLKKVYLHLEKLLEEKSDALDEVEKTNSSKISFFQNISHELRTPMHGILSFSRLGMSLDLQENPDKVPKYFTNINKSATRLMDMINSIMDLAKLESGHMNFKFTNINFSKIIIQVIDEFKASCIEKGVSIEFDSELEIRVDADVEMIALVLRNLFSNALKMTEPESNIEVNALIIKNKLVVSVCDKGPGIPDDEIVNIFEKFVQAGEGRKHGGTGLGLALCREIILAHKGRIVATNRINGGACFEFIIPVKQIN